LDGGVEVRLLIGGHSFESFQTADRRYHRAVDTMTAKPDATPKSAGPPAPSRRGWRLAVIVVFGLAILLGGWRACQAMLEEHDAKERPWDGRPAFVETTYPTAGVPANAGPLQRLWIVYVNFQLRHSKKTPGNYTFGGRPTTPCSIHGLLNQCMTVTGTRYLMAKEVSAGWVSFGHSNTLGGAQWVAAFEAALQTNRPEFFDHAGKAMRRENLLLVREKAGVVKVIPPSRLADYQKAGLVSAAWVAPSSSANSPQ
jgi:hypothetical protein